jgi:hypothetical protein
MVHPRSQPLEARHYGRAETRGNQSRTRRSGITHQKPLPLKDRSAPKFSQNRDFPEKPIRPQLWNHSFSHSLKVQG